MIFKPLLHIGKCLEVQEMNTNRQTVSVLFMKDPISLHHGGDYSSWGPGKKYYNTILIHKMQYSMINYHKNTDLKNNIYIKSKIIPKIP